MVYSLSMDSRLRGNDGFAAGDLKTVIPATGGNDFLRKQESMLNTRPTEA